MADKTVTAGTPVTADPEKKAPVTETEKPKPNALMQFFKYEHLQGANRRDVSKTLCDLSEHIAKLPTNAESTVALRKLLEAKDAAVVAVDMNPRVVGKSTMDILCWEGTKPFAYDHLPQHLQDVSKPFYEAAQKLIERIDVGHFRAMMFDRLLESKNAAVRAVLQVAT